MAVCVCVDVIVFGGSCTECFGENVESVPMEPFSAVFETRIVRRALVCAKMP